MSGSDTVVGRGCLTALGSALGGVRRHGRNHGGCVCDAGWVAVKNVLRKKSLLFHAGVCCSGELGTGPQQFFDGKVVRTFLRRVRNFINVGKV